MKVPKHFKVVHIAENPAEGHLVLAFLEGEGISARLENGEYHRGLGTVPTMVNVSPTILVAESDYESAMEVMARYNKVTPGESGE